MSIFRQRMVVLSEIPAPQFQADEDGVERVVGC
jgi:hypothetical protein